MQPVFFKGKRKHLDDLTKLYTRDMIFSYQEYLVENGIPFVFAIIDIDNFKSVNDTYGHKIGDEVLIEFANKMSEMEIPGVFGRFGGDEFLLVLENVTEYQEEWEWLHKILKRPNAIHLDEHPELKITITLGAARFPTDSTNLETVMEKADKALYRGKMKGRNCFIIYLPEKHDIIDLKSERDKSFSPMYLHNKAYELLSSAATPFLGIKRCIDYFGSYLMLDHICIQVEDEFLFTYYHPICKYRNFKPIDSTIIDNLVNPMTGIFHMNSITEDWKYYSIFQEQNIAACFYKDIQWNGHQYGFLRADIMGPSSGRIWQHLDMSVLSNICNIIAMILHFNNLELKDVK